MIRHGETYGNSLKRYVGKTDENISEKGEEELKKLKYKSVDILYSSPMKRCVETAKILFPNIEIITIEKIEECNFGEFENKNYKELSLNLKYQNWIDSGGTLPFPGGESVENFKKRSIEGVVAIIENSKDENNAKTIAIVSHNGTIMAIMQNFFGGDYYKYSVKNGKGYMIEINEEVKTWKKL